MIIKVVTFIVYRYKNASLTYKVTFLFSFFFLQGEMRGLALHTDHRSLKLFIFQKKRYTAAY